MLICTAVTPIAIEAISWKYFMIFVICDMIFIVIFYFFYPETKNKTLEEIAAIFGDDVSLSMFEYRDDANRNFSLLKPSKRLVNILTISRRRAQTFTLILIMMTRVQVLT